MISTEIEEDLDRAVRTIREAQQDEEAAVRHCCFTNLFDCFRISLLSVFLDTLVKMVYSILKILSLSDLILACP